MRITRVTFNKTLTLPQPFALSPISSSSYRQQRHTYWFHPDHTSATLSTGLGSSSYISTINGRISQHIEYFPFGETLVEEHKNSNNSPYKFNGKMLDAETGNYYYGARFYNPKWSIWLSVDPLAEKRQGISPYNFVQNNPLNRIDPTGALDESAQNLDDIRFRDKDGNLIATYYTEKFDEDVYLPVSASGVNINLNKKLENVDLEDIDAVGIGGSWDFTFVMGGGKSLEAVYFLDGQDKGSSEIFETTRQNVGINGGVGVYGIFADFHGADSELTKADYAGRSFSISIGIKGPWISSYSKFWAPAPQIKDKSGFKSLFNKELRLWSGYTVGGGAGGGLQWSKQNTSIYKK